MLTELNVKNLVLIDELHLKFSSGFTAITGETGAGKSVLLNSLKILQGEKAKPYIRKNEDFLKVEACFNIPNSPELYSFLEDLEIDTDEEELILERHALATGKNRCRINGTIVNIGQLKKVCEYLFTIHGQNDQQHLNAKNQLLLLDHFAGAHGLRNDFTKAHSLWKKAQSDLWDFKEDLKNISQQQEFFAFQYKELKEANLKLGEEEKIEQTLKESASIEKINKHLLTALDCFENNGSNLPDLISQLKKSLMELSKYSSEFSEASEMAESLFSTIPEIHRAISNYQIPGDLSPEKIDVLNATLARWQKLKSKYKMDMEGLIELREKRKKELETSRDSSALLKDLENELQLHFKRVLEIGKTLSEKRKQGSKKFEKAVNANLSHLGMAGAEILCSWQASSNLNADSDDISPLGLEKLDLQLRPAKGLDSKPITQIASGGETSRIMLAIKTVLSQSDPIPLLVFDEIDAGIGGITGNRVAESLKKTSEHHQVIVITHLHQVASQAEWQMQVEKQLLKGQTQTQVRELTAEERVLELARMMGDSNSEQTLKHAQKLLEENL